MRRASFFQRQIKTARPIYFRFGRPVGMVGPDSRAARQFSAERVLPFDRYATRKFAETSPSGRLGTLRVLFAVQQRLTISTRNFADFETTARATFLTSFVSIQRTKHSNSPAFQKQKTAGLQPYFLNRSFPW